MEKRRMLEEVDCGKRRMLNMGETQKRHMLKKRHMVNRGRVEGFEYNLAFFLHFFAASDV